MRILASGIHFFIGTLIMLFCSGCCSPTSAVPHIPPEKIKDHISSLGIKPTPQILLVDTQRQTLAILQEIGRAHV